MRRLWLMAAVSVCMLALGFGGGAYYSRNHRIDTYLEWMLRGQMLERSKYAFVLMRAIGDGRTELAYRLTEDAVMSGLLQTDTWPGAEGEIHANMLDYRARVSKYYRDHPDRRAALNAQYAKYPDWLALVDASDGGSSNK
jgi:hypothetical protein